MSVDLACTPSSTKRCRATAHFTPMPDGNTPVFPTIPVAITIECDEMKCHGNVFYVYYCYYSCGRNDMPLLINVVIINQYIIINKWQISVENQCHVLKYLRSSHCMDRVDYVHSVLVFLSCVITYVS